MMKDFVATRPRRPRSGRVIAGVAAGIGRRYGIDPVIVRVALVVSAIYGGAGLICYLLGWLLLTQDGDQVSPAEALLGRGHSSTSKPLTAVLCIALIPSVNFVFGGYFSMVAGLIVLGAALFLLHRYRADQGWLPPSTDAPIGVHPEAGGMTDSTPTSHLGATGAPGNPHGPQDAVPDQPPAWDPLGAAPFAWDLPDPAPVPPAPPVLPPRQRGPRVALATLGVLFVSGATMALLASSVGWLTPGHIAGVLAAIGGVGLLAGAFAHTGRGLIPLGLLLSAAAFGLTSTHFDGWHGGGDTSVRPTSISDVQPLYQSSVGHMVLDLRGLPDSGTVTTKAELSAGDLTVLVPADATVHATCSTNAGNLDCLGQQESGPGHSTLRVDQSATDGSGLTINVDAEGGVGRVEVANHG